MNWLVAERQSDWGRMGGVRRRGHKTLRARLQDHRRLPVWLLAFSHRTRAALRACSRRCSGVSRFALILPPLRPQAAKRRRMSSGNLSRTLAFYVAGQASVNLI